MPAHLRQFIVTFVVLGATHSALAGDFPKVPFRSISRCLSGLMAGVSQRLSRSTPQFWLQQAEAASAKEDVVGFLTALDGLSKLFARQGRWQEKIWVDQAMGHTDDAHQLEQEIGQVLREGKIVREKAPKGDLGSPLLVTFQFGKRKCVAVRKTDLREVAAYELDRALDLKRVPMTVQRIENGKPVIYQLSIPVQKGEREAVVVQDSLMESYRWFVGISGSAETEYGHLIAAQNDASFRLSSTATARPEKLDSVFVQKLQSANQRKIADALTPYLSEAEVVSVFDRLKQAVH